MSPKKFLDASVSPQATAARNELFGDAASAAAQAPLPASPPGVPQYVLNTPRQPANIDQQIAEVEARLDRRISQLTMEMNSWSAQLSGQIAELLRATRPAAAAVTPEAAVAAPLGPAVAAAPMAAPGPAQRLDPWAQCLEAARLPPGPPALVNTQLAALRSASRRGPLKPLHIKDVAEPKVYSGGAQCWKEWDTNFRRFVDARDERLGLILDKVETLRGKPVTAEHEAEWKRDPQLDLDPNVMGFKTQLSMFLEKYTSGPDGLIVTQCGK